MLIDFKGSLNMSSSDFGPITNTSSLPRPTMSVKYFNSSSIFPRCFSNPCASLYPSREMTVFWCNPNPKYRQSPTGTQSIWDLLFSQKEDNLSLTSISLSSGTQKSYEYILEWFKTQVSSQTFKLMAATKLSDYLGLKHYKKAKKIKHFIHLRLAQRPQSLSTYHSI